MYKSTALREKMAALKMLRIQKSLRGGGEGKIMADVKIKAGPKILADGEIPAAREKQGDGIILAGVEISTSDEISAAIEKPAEPEK
jgi:hypothetical protein